MQCQSSLNKGLTSNFLVRNTELLRFTQESAILSLAKMETCYYVIAIVVYVASTTNVCIGSENIALGKNTKQSSVYDRWDSSKAVDGCSKTNVGSNCCTHTAGSQNEAWWQVDLQTQVSIESMKIIYRVDNGYLDRLAGYQIYLSNTTIWRTEDACYQDTTPDLASMSSVQTVACRGVARYLTIYNDRQVKSYTWYSDDALLELCEVEVYGCPLRQYGAGNCASRCSTTCVDDLCHPTTGKCTEDCDDGFFGPSCDPCSTGCTDPVCNRTSGYCEDCDDGFFGPSCDPCSTGCTDPVCNRTSGYCGCKKGYHGNGCSQLCSTKCTGNACVKETGFCAGCDQGFRGDACRDRCPVNCKANTCFQYSGSCIECEPWFYGTMCDKTCVSISCKDHICNQTDGQCTECAPGLYGAACDQICPDNCNEECDRITGLCNGCDQGVHGLYCSEICPQNCQSNTCIQDNGHCTECQSGYYGEHCDKICPQNCKDNMCDKTNGDCKDLTETESINTAAIGIGAGFGVVILVLVILVIVQNRRLSMKNKDTTGPIHMSDILQRAKTNDIDGPYEEIDTQNGKQLAKNATADNDYDRLDPNDKVVPNLYETA